MKNKIFNISIPLILLFLFSTSRIYAQVFADVESGFVFTGYNDVRIPGDKGTLFSLNKDFDADANAFIRIRAGYTINSKHTISLLYAPLLVNSSGITNKAILFEGETFPSNTSIDARYRFNSYRLTYRYDFVNKPKLDFGLGITAKIRDAEIELKSQDRSSSKSNVGFVPLINFRFNYRINDTFGLLAEGDALAAPQGRAEDILLAGTYKLAENSTIRLGYRLLEGGADNEEVYNFALFHYATVGFTYTLKNKTINH